MFPWITGTDDLRIMLSDGPLDRYRYRKRVLGQIDGTNLSFKTFEDKRITDFLTSTAPLGVYLNGVLLVAADFTSDDLTTGEFVLVAAPVDGDVLEATYYVQWFLDTELTAFLASASNYITNQPDYTQIAEGFQPGALKYAAADAYQKLAIKFAEMTSETFRLEDMPADRVKAAIDSYKQMADQFRKEAKALRDDYYTRKGEALAPRFASIPGRVREVAPRR